MLEYKKELTKVSYNSDDPNLEPIVVELPTVESFFGKPWDEAIKEIDGYGLPIEKQYYDYYRDKGYFALPAKLKNIEQAILRKNPKLKEDTSFAPEDLFDELESDPVYYKEEIDWIKRTIKRSIQGYWCFINGRPTYIDGWHYTYLNYWPIENKNRRDRLPDYRDVDRRIFLFFRWASAVTTSDFKYELTYKKKGTNKAMVKYFNNIKSAQQYASMEAVQGSWILDEGKFTVDMGYRTCYGVVFPKRRRVGATFMGTHVCTRICTGTSLGTFAIQALTETTAVEDVYQKKVIAPWRTTYPFFFKPAASKHDTNGLVFVPSKKSNIGADNLPHGGWIRPRSSANKAFDGNSLYAYLNDESGKKQNSDVLHEFSDTIKNALAQGNSIHGFALYTSTFGEFEAGGGKEYFELCKKSYWHKKNDNGHTASGLVTLFVPAYDGYDGYVDRYGESIIDDPETPFINLKGEEKSEGARTFLMKTRTFYEETKDWSALNTEIRNNPFTLAEASSPSNNSNYFDIGVLRDRISALKFGEQKTRDVNLTWENGVKWSRVIVTDPPAGTKGKWIVSILPSDELRSRFIWDDIANSFSPHPEVMNRYVLGCDPFKFGTKDIVGKKKSDGGGAVYWKQDAISDQATGDKISGDFVATYRNRCETTDEYCEDMLLGAVFFNAMTLPERNVDHVIKYFKANQATGYLMHLLDTTTQKVNPIAGIYTDVAVKEKLFGKLADFVKTTGHRARHIELLEEIQQAKSLDDMTDLDLFTAAGMALLGAENTYSDIIQKQNESRSSGDMCVEMYD